MFNLTERWHLRPLNSNPVRHVERFPENAMERFLSDEELARLAAVLNEREQDGSESLFAITAIRLLIFTGARSGEILNLRWANVDLERAMLRLDDSKTGRKPIFLPPPARELLVQLPCVEGNPHVIVGDKEGAALVNIRKPWHRIREAAGLDGVRLHDLRHTFASTAAAGGASLQMIGRLLGHSQIATTMRYSHLANDPVRSAADAVGDRIEAAMSGKTAEVVRLDCHGTPKTGR